MIINLYVPRLAVLILFILVFGNCGPPQNKPIIVFGSPDSPRLRQAVAGLKARLKAGPVEVVWVPEFGPEGRETLRRVRQANPRLLVVLGTPALLLAAPVVKQVPVVFGLVANPYFTGAAYDPAHPEIHQENVTGIASPAPLAAALQHGVSLLGQGSWGLLYDPTDGVAVDLARRFETEARRFGVQPLTETSAAAATDGDGLDAADASGGPGDLPAPGAQRGPLRPPGAGLGPPDESPGGERPPRRVSSRARSCGWPWITGAWGRRSATWPGGSWPGKRPQDHPHCGKNAA